MQQAEDEAATHVVSENLEETTPSEEGLSSDNNTTTPEDTSISPEIQGEATSVYPKREFGDFQLVIKRMLSEELRKKETIRIFLVDQRKNPAFTTFYTSETNDLFRTLVRLKWQRYLQK